MKHFIVINFLLIWIAFSGCRALNPVTKNNRSLDASLLLVANSSELVRSASGDKLILRLKTKIPATCRFKLSPIGENQGDRETNSSNCSIEYPRLSFLELLKMDDPKKNYSIDVNIIPDPATTNPPPAEWITLSERVQNTNADREMIRMKYDSVTGAGEIHKLEFSSLEDKNQVVQFSAPQEFECKNSEENYLENIWQKSRAIPLSVQKIGSTGFAILNQLKTPSDADSTLRFQTKALTKSERWEIGFEEKGDSQVIVAPSPALWNSVEIKVGDQNKTLEQGKDMADVSIPSLSLDKSKGLNLQWSYASNSEKTMIILQLISTKNGEIVQNCFGSASKLNHSISTNQLSGEYNFYIALVDRQAVDVANYQGAAWMIESFDWRSIKLQF